MIRYTVSLLLALACSTVMLLAQSTVDTRIAVNSQKDDKTFVVIIANENYKHEESVPFARNDGEVMSAYCQSTLGIPEQNIHVALDATLNEMNYQFDWLEEALKAYDGEARAIIYYSGHGMPDETDKEAFLLPVDGYSKSAASAVSMKQLYSKLGTWQSRSIMVFLDACFSGAKRDGKMLASSRGVAVKAKAAAVSPNTVVFAAAQADQTAYPTRPQKHGMFTYYILEHLQQTGGATTLGKLSDYVTTQVKRMSIVENGKSQTPIVTAAAENTGWRNWKLAAVAAKQYQERKPAAASSSPAAKPATTVATPGAATQPAAPQVKIVTNHPDFKIAFQRCVASGSTVFIDLLLSNASDEDIDNLWVSGYGYEVATEAYDDKGNVYGREREIDVKLANSNEYAGYNGQQTAMLPSVPVKMTVKIEGVKSTATMISRLKLSFECEKWGIYRQKPATLRNIPINRD